MLGLRVVLLGAPTSLASIMVIGPHHAAATYVGEAPKRASGSTWFGTRASQLEIGLCSCVLVAISPRRAKLGGVPRGMRPAGTLPPPPPPPQPVPPPGAPQSGPAGAGLGIRAA
jgi:hypothetical protein